jgi:plastocyanin
MPRLLPLLAAASATLATLASAAVYEVIVGGENVKTGTLTQVFAPNRLVIRPGDTVVFSQTTNEIHTVTFLGGAVTQIPPLLIPYSGGGLQVNPIAGFPSQPSGGAFAPNTYINSGVMTGVQQWNISFPAQGTFTYVCIVHGQSMGGVIRVANRRKVRRIPTPERVSQLAAAYINTVQTAAEKQMPAIRAALPPPTPAPGGFQTHYLWLGATAKSEVMVDFAWFFPRNLTARRGDTLKFLAYPTNMDTPHTVTFLNGAAVPPFVKVIPRQNAPPVLQINPAVADPKNYPGVVVTRQGIFNSGFLQPGQNATFRIYPSMSKGPLQYTCLLHDGSGMRGTINVV